MGGRGRESLVLYYNAHCQRIAMNRGVTNKISSSLDLEMFLMKKKGAKENCHEKIDWSTYLNIIEPVDLASYILFVDIIYVHNFFMLCSHFNKQKINKLVSGCT